MINRSHDILNVRYPDDVVESESFQPLYLSTEQDSEKKRLSKNKSGLSKKILIQKGTRLKVGLFNAILSELYNLMNPSKIP